MKTVMDFIFLGSKITADDDCSHKIKRYSLLGRRAVRSISSVAKLCLALWELVDGGMSGFLSFTISQSLLKLMSPELVMPSNHLILCRPLLLLSNFPSIRVFSNESGLHIRWPKYWNFSFSISPCNEYSGLISFSIHRFDLLAVQGTFCFHNARQIGIQSFLSVTLLQSLFALGYE